MIWRLLTIIFFQTLVFQAYAQSDPFVSADAFPKGKYEARRGAKLKPECVIESAKDFELGERVVVVYIEGDKGYTIETAINNADPKNKLSHVQLKDSPVCSHLGQIYIFGPAEFARITKEKKKKDEVAIRQRADNLRSFTYYAMGVKIISLKGFHYRAPFADDSKMMLPAAEVYLRHAPFKGGSLDPVSVEASVQVARTLSGTSITYKGTEVGKQTSLFLSIKPGAFYRLNYARNRFDLNIGFYPFGYSSLKHSGEGGLKAAPFRDYTLSTQTLHLGNTIRIGADADLFVDLDFDLLASAKTPVVKEGEIENLSDVKSPFSFQYSVGGSFNFNKFFANFLYRGSHLMGKISYVSGESVSVQVHDQIILLGGGLRW